jgi:hypothetical protein
MFCPSEVFTIRHFVCRYFVQFDILSFNVFLPWAFFTFVRHFVGEPVAEGLICWTDTEMRHQSKDWLVFNSDVHTLLHHPEAGMESSSSGELSWAAVRCPAESIGGQVPEASRQGAGLVQVQRGPGMGLYLNQAYLRQDAFLHDLMKPVHAVRDISDKNYGS